MEQRPGTSPRNNVSQSVSKPRILLVEDEDRIRMNLCTLLSRSGYAVTAVSGGDEGLELARTARFDVVVADMVMEGYERFELLDALLVVLERTPVVVITGNTLQLGADEAKQRGASAYVAKPFPIAALREAIDASVHG